MEKIRYSVSTKKFNLSLPGITSSLLKESFVFRFKNGEFITTELGTLDYLYFIIEGRAKVITTQENGKRIILQFLSINDLIGDLTIVEAEETIKDVVAMGNTVCLGIPIDLVSTRLLTENEFLLFLSQYIGKKLILRMDHFKEQQTQELKLRLAKLFLEVSINNIYNEKHTEISEYLGVSYRHFMHTFKFFKEENYLKKENTHYVVDSKKLELFIKAHT